MTALTLKDRVKQSVTGTPHTGAVQLASAVAGFQTLGAAEDGKLIPGFFTDGSAWEVGKYTYTNSGTSLARTTILASSNSGSAVDLTSAAIFNCDIPASVLQNFVNARETLGATRTYYVRTDGNDGNTGLVNNSGGAFLTLQHAWDVVAALDLNGNFVTIQVGDGTYAGSLVANQAPVGVQAGVTIQGHSGSPSSVLISTGGNTCISVGEGVTVTIKDMKLVSSANGLVCTGGSTSISGMDFGAITGVQIRGQDKAKLFVVGNYTISGAAAAHLQFLNGAEYVSYSALTVTITGTPAFGVAYAISASGGLIDYEVAPTFSGSATGPRYLANSNSVIISSGATFPGNSAGSTGTGGQYL